MPELPEVQTTVNGLNSAIVGMTISDAWTDYNSSFHAGKDSIKNPVYFRKFKNEVIGAHIIEVTRRAKNILIYIEKGRSKGIILVHMKMTGHILCGRFLFNGKNKRDPWTPAPDERAALHDPFNRFIHFVLTLSSAKTSAKKRANKHPITHLALSDMRKFAKVTLISGTHIEENILGSEHLSKIGPEPLDKSFTFQVFKERLGRRPNGRVKTVLMDQEIIAGVGNIYSDEALWRAGINPEERVADISDVLLKKLYAATITVLKKGIDFGGDSMSDYRNINGERGKFQEKHRAYRRTGKKCTKPGCKGAIMRKVVGGRSAHFCSMHQQLLKNRRTTYVVK